MKAADSICNVYVLKLLLVVDQKAPHLLHDFLLKLNVHFYLTDCVRQTKDSPPKRAEGQGSQVVWRRKEG